MQHTFTYALKKIYAKHMKPRKICEIKNIFLKFSRY